MLATAFLIIAIAIAFLLLLYKPYKETYRLKKSNLPILRLPPLWKLFLLCVFKEKDFNFRQWLFQLGYAHCRMYSKEKLFSYTVEREMIVRLFKPEYVEMVLNNNIVTKKGIISRIFRPWLGDGLLFSSGEKWKNRRRLLTQAFHFKILEDFCPVFNKHSFILIDKLKRIEKPQVDILSLMRFCTLDIISETAMGVEMNSQRNEESEYVNAIVKIQELIFRRTMSPWLWSKFVFNLSSTGREFNRVVNVIHNFTRKVISEKKKMFRENEYELELENNDENIYFKTKKRMVFLDLLLYHHYKDESLTEENIREEVDTFMFAGHDTTSSAVSWALYNIGLYQDIQHKAYEEILSIFGQDKERYVTAKDTKELKYLECVLKESLRVYPSVPIISRSHGEDFHLSEDMKIPGGAFITIEIFAMHHDPEIFSNPEIFDPERFFPENCKNRHKFSYIPFSAGSRNCLGQKFAMMEVKTIIANILRHFRIYSVDPRDKVVECGEIILKSLTGLTMKFHKR